MKAMRLHRPGQPLILEEVDRPTPLPDEVLIRVWACGVCRTDLHIVDGDLPAHVLPLIPGHEIVGEVIQAGAEVTTLRIGQRVGVPWLGRTCGTCEYCTSGRENLCDRPAFTGYDLDGGYAEFAVAHAAACIPLPDNLGDSHQAPLLCAGLIGFRAYRAAGPVKTLGIIGFGAAAHIIAQIARADGVKIFAFTKPSDEAARRFALDLGAAWAGGSDQSPPGRLDAVIIFAPDGSLVPRALQLVRKGGKVVCAGIHMSDIPAFPYFDLWGERHICSVANLTRADAADFFARIQNIELKTVVVPYALSDANVALSDLRDGRLNGAAVLVL
ncbi:zinc-dependent alcohol dehydrogenase family protein [Devosia sp.]|uniref:zinc-dependent alcohol dehydrogenase family protein n=1 Tax=Devosia sp. TaxID=1871048 RepID=UPI00292F2561|nr:zinc-dependent alcohol dehydrogenase family protein [Devosia sp.]